jgi:hypothetical protein
VSGEFNVWLIIVGLVAGAALTWLVMSETTRRDAEIDERETDAEAAWIAHTLGEPHLDAELASDVLRAHRRYLGFPPPDALVDPGELAELQPVAEQEPVRPAAARPADGGTPDRG